MLKVYLDSCCIQRPLDDTRSVRIATEATAILGVLALWEAGSLQLVSSEVLIFEATNIPSQERKTFMLDILDRFSPYIQVNEALEALAASFTVEGIKPLDALHLASAVQLEVDYFCTCDDRFLAKAKTVSTTLMVVSPLELITILDK